MHNLLPRQWSSIALATWTPPEKILPRRPPGRAQKSRRPAPSGVVCRQRGDLDCALELLKKACFESPSNPLFISDWADALQDNKLYREALHVMHGCCQSTRTMYRRWLKSALALKNTGDFETALINVQKALRIKPDFPQAHNAAGLVCAARENTKKQFSISAKR